VAGLVVSVPYASRETPAARWGQQIAELLDVGLVMGHGYRNRDKDLGPLIWVNVDRGTEGLFDAKEKLGGEQETPRAKEVFKRWMDCMRQSIALARGPVPMIVSLRNHSEKLDGSPLQSIEVATHGFQVRDVKRLKGLYERLLDEVKPEVRLVLAFDLTDFRYDVEGTSVEFSFTESDAKRRGYMEPQYCKKGLALFFSARIDMTPADEKAYASIVGRLIEEAFKIR
jgi:hypothetical protein